MLMYCIYLYAMVPFDWDSSYAILLSVTLVYQWFRDTYFSTAVETSPEIKAITG